MIKAINKSVIIIFNLFIFAYYLYGNSEEIKLDGRWTSSSKNIIYLHKDSSGLSIQVVLRGSGDTFIWQATWIEENKTFKYKTSIGEYKGEIKNANTIVVSGLTNINIIKNSKNKMDKIKQTFVWIRAGIDKVKKKKQDKTIVSIDNIIGDIKYNSIETRWQVSKKLISKSNLIKNKFALVYGGTNNYGEWFAVIVPVQYLEEVFGISLIFIRANNKWILSYTKLMVLINKTKDGYKWLDGNTNITSMKNSNKWELKAIYNNQFYFKYNGSIKIDKNKQVKEIIVKGISIPSL